MAFSSVQFLFVFLPLSLAVYWLCPKWLRNAVLAAFSLLFFAWAGLKGAAILVLLAGINWLGGLSLGRLAHKRPLLILLILLDLAVLGGFKYAGFAAETVNGADVAPLIEIACENMTIRVEDPHITVYPKDAAPYQLSIETP